MTTTTNPSAATLRRMDRLDRLYNAARARGLPPREAERAAIAAARRRRRRNPTDLEPTTTNPSGGVRVVYNRLLGGWYVVRGPHQTPISGRFDSKAAALASIARRNPTASNPRVSFTPQSLYDTPAALSDSRYRAWLGDFSNAGQRLAGVNPIHQVRLASKARRWFLDGLSPYEAVQRWQGSKSARRNPSREYASNPAPQAGQLPQLAALGVLVWAGYQLLQPIIHGGAKAIAGANQPAGGGGTPAPRASASNWRPLSLTDTGGVPLESLGGRVRQQAAWIAQYSPGSPDNEYGVGGVFFDGAGNTWQLVSGDQLAGPDVPGGDTSQTRTLGSFAA